MKHCWLGIVCAASGFFARYPGMCQRLTPSIKTIAIEGFTASLAHELEFFNVRVKLVEPGYGPTTRFTSNGGRRMEGLIPEAYAPFAEPIFAAFAQPAAVTTEFDVAEAVYRAANDESGPVTMRRRASFAGRGSRESWISVRERVQYGVCAPDSHAFSGLLNSAVVCSSCFKRRKDQAPSRPPDSTDPPLP
jgi:hypothetical protein